MKIAFFGSSLLSAYWNGACTYYRGIVRALHARGHDITFYEPDAYDRQAHRDIPAPPYATLALPPPPRSRTSSSTTPPTPVTSVPPPEASTSSPRPAGSAWPTTCSR